jgi:flavin-dependent dehydrogenase
VTVIERDPVGDFTNGDDAFAAWERPGVPQFRQAHFFGARMRNLLLERIPEVVSDLLRHGVQESNIFQAIAPREFWEPEDEALTGLMTRRAGLELALRRFAERQPGITMRSPASATDLVIEDGHVPRVRGVVLAGGERVLGDIVLDCGGRRSPAARWLAQRGIDIPLREQACYAACYARYFRLTGDPGVPPMLVFAVRGDGAGASVIGYPGDHDSFGITFVVRPDDTELRVLRHTWAWDVAASLFPALERWLDPAVAKPFTDVHVMTSLRNTRREYVVDGAPRALGLLPVGDSLCTTNPGYFWGSSMAITYAYAATDAIDASDGDPAAAVIGYDEAVRAEADAVYKESAAMDRLRMYRLTGTPVPADDKEEMERQALIEHVHTGSMRNPVLGRAMLRTIGLYHTPDAILDGPGVIESARLLQRLDARRPPRKTGPDRDELLALLAAAAPAS